MIKRFNTRINMKQSHTGILQRKPVLKDLIEGVPVFVKTNEGLQMYVRAGHSMYSTPMDNTRKVKETSLANADYDSGWKDWTRTSHDGSGDNPLKLLHGLQRLPSLAIGYFAPHQDPDDVTWFTAVSNAMQFDYNYGLGMYVDDTRVYFFAGDSASLRGAPAPSNTSTCAPTTYYNGSVKVLLWK